MAERGTVTEPSGEVKNKKSIVFPIPSFDVEIDKSAAESARLLIQNPESLIQFSSDLGDRLFLASVDEDVAIQDRLRKLLAEIKKNIDKSDANDLALDPVISETGAMAILESLPKTDEKKQIAEDPDKNALVEVTESLAKSLLVTRFEKSSDWRNAFRNNYQLFHAAAMSHDPNLLNKYFDLILGNYKNVLSQETTAWRSLFITQAAVAPEDEELLLKHYELSKSITLMAEITGRSEDRKKLKKDSSGIILQVGAARVVYRVGFDPETDEGKIMYRTLLRKHENESGSRQKYGNLNFNKLITRRLMPDQIEIARLAALHAERDDALTSSQVEDNSNQMYTQRVLPDLDDYSVFPYNITFGESEERRAVRSMVSSSVIRKQLYETAERYASTQEGIWELVSFAQNGLQGYFIAEESSVPGLSKLPPAEKAKVIRKLIEEEKLVSYWEDAKKRQMVGGETAVMWQEPKKKIMFLFSKYEYADKSYMETALDLAIPDEYRRNSMEVLAGLVKQRYRVPRNFTKLPSVAGDVYDLENHVQIPGVFSNALISKRLEGGLNFALKIANINGELEEDRLIYGNITFPQDRLKIEFAGEAAKLPDDLKWIVEHVMLSLTERTCCKPLNEETRDKIEGDGQNEAEIKEESSSGGFLVHVGGRRMTGAPKEFTEKASANFKNAMDDLGRDTGGLSLVFINTEHRINFPKCKRFVTWNKGWEKPGSKPVQRRPPEKLLHLS